MKEVSANVLLTEVEMKVTLDVVKRIERNIIEMMKNIKNKNKKKEAI